MVDYVAIDLASSTMFYGATYVGGELTAPGDIAFCPALVRDLSVTYQFLVATRMDTGQTLERGLVVYSSNGDEGTSDWAQLGSDFLYGSSAEPTYGFVVTCGPGVAEWGDSTEGLFTLYGQRVAAITGASYGIITDGGDDPGSGVAVIGGAHSGEGRSFSGRPSGVKS